MNPKIWRRLSKMLDCRKWRPVSSTTLTLMDCDTASNSKQKAYMKRLLKRLSSFASTIVSLERGPSSRSRFGLQLFIR